METGNNLYLTGEFSGSGVGAVVLRGARIHGEVTCVDGTFTGTDGPALNADGLVTDDNLRLAGVFSGVGVHGVVRLINAKIGGQLQCEEGHLTWITTTSTEGSAGSLVLLGAEVNGQFRYNQDCQTTTVPGLNVDGLTYSGIPTLRSDSVANPDWTTVIAHQTVRYAPQPWQQLACAWKDAGHPQEATRVLIAQQDDRRRRLRDHPILLPLSSFFFRYGYQPWRAWIGLFLVAVIGVTFALGLGSARDTWPGTETTTAIAAYPPTSTAPATPCSVADRVGMGLEWTVPLASFASNGCQINTSVPPGQTLAIISYILQIMAWAMAAIAVAGYTGIVKRL
ncbi:MAG: hypothetical protein FWF75_06055 [Propionibacteriaceae bacterium]|nr:hypothetical protein [Propionibacteriaceae bacterium]